MASKKKAQAQPRQRTQPAKAKAPTERGRAAATGPKTSLRPERIQSALRGSEPGGRSKPAGRRLSEAEIETEMADLPSWRLAADRRSIGCAMCFPAYPLAEVFLNLVTSLAELSAYYPEIAVRGPRVSLRLASPQGRGLTAEVFEFAHALDGASQLGCGVVALAEAAQGAEA